MVLEAANNIRYEQKSKYWSKFDVKIDQVKYSGASQEGI